MDAKSFERDIPLSLATSAHSGTSFTPEKRGEQMVEEYGRTVAQVYETLKGHAVRGKTEHLLDEVFTAWKSRYRRLYTVWLVSKSRCLSTMIAGPSNFNVRRAEKTNASEHKRNEALCDFMETGVREATKQLRPDLQPIRTEDADALERLKADLAKLEKLQERMKAANAAIRKHKKDGADAQVTALVALGFKEGQAKDLLQPDFAGRIGFPDFEIRNNGASIRRIEGRIVAVSQAKATPVRFEEGTSGVKLEDDAPENRVRLIFPGKPEAAVRDRLKANGFRWAPTSGAWQAYRNNTSLAFAATMLKGE